MLHKEQVTILNQIITEAARCRKAYRVILVPILEGCSSRAGIGKAPFIDPMALFP